MFYDDDDDDVKNIFPEVYGATDQYDSYHKPYNEDNDNDMYVRPKVIDVAFKQPRAKAKRIDTSRKSDFSFNRTARAAAPSNAVVVKRVRREEPDIEQLFEGLSNVPGGPIEIRPDNDIVIPYKTRMAADVLMIAHDSGEIILSQQARSDLRNLIKCQDEYTMIDPPIVIWDTLFTGTCTILLKEVVRLSILLLALYLECTYEVEAIEGATSEPKTYADVNVEPYEDVNIDNAQPFGCTDAVMEEMQHRFGSESDDRLRYLKIHLTRIGYISSVEACDPGFIQDQLQVLGSVLKNERRSVQEPRLMGQIDNTEKVMQGGARRPN